MWNSSGPTRGLSPRVRGNRLSHAFSLYYRRSIPACAGEPSSLVVGQHRHQVYPRVCGGTPRYRPRNRPSTGLSPRVRGNPWMYSVYLAPSFRSIPACAGEPLQPTLPRQPRTVYPRVCGGTPCFLPPSHAPPGLSPRVRGNRLKNWNNRKVQRSIPACAGEPRTRRRPDAQSRVYPRVCGGTPCFLPPSHAPPGLSPRVRGNRLKNWNNRKVQRSIPACAGEPRTRRRPDAQSRVYPRVCGGTATPGITIRPRLGLSPRVRGNLLNHLVSHSKARSIPACAGEPRGDALTRTASPVYPRVCGGTHLLP